jgi:hypothetical protein
MHYNGLNDTTKDWAVGYPQVCSNTRVFFGPIDTATDCFLPAV